MASIHDHASQFAHNIYAGILDVLDAARPVLATKPTSPGTDPNTEADVDRYLDQLRTTLLMTINDNKRITL